ncbi:CAS/CSE protein [Suillus spraguei]|nr:CAS/CSE protein [Suillus spraguei]
MSDIASLLQASLQPASRKQAEQQLHTLASQQGFLEHLLTLILNASYDRSTRLAGGIYLKNVAKLRWEEDDAPLPEADKAALRSQLVPAMIALSDPTDKAIRAQIAESVALIAELDFPVKWTDLIDQLILSLSQTDYSINVGVLQTAHSIFNQWRAQVRSDELFTEINFVLSRFMQPFLDICNQTATILLSSPAPPNIAIVTQAQIILIDIFYDFTYAHDSFFAPQTGLFQRFMSWDPAELRSDPDETQPSLPAQLKTKIFEIGELYIKLFPDQLSRSPAVEGFVQSVWELIGSNKLPGVADDSLVSQSLRFISTAIRSGFYKSLFSSRDTIASLVQGMEQFEDEPLEFIRLDLAFGGSASEVATRRQAAADVLQALVSSGYQTEATEIVGSWITSGLQQYNSNPAQNWKAKDSAIYLLTAHGVTSTNALVDVVKFFSEHVYQDLRASAGSIHEILYVDAIRFLLTFRNRDQLLSVLPLLVRHLNADHYVTYTYAAITIDRILFIKKGTQLLFSQADIHDIAADLLNALLSKIEAASLPEKVAENDHLMKCAMRIIVTARQTLTPIYQQVLQRLVNILGVIAKNPSNPNFDQYIFESISALLRFVVSGTPSTLPVFEQALFGPFTFILQQDIDQYIPYAFQILAQMLEAHTTGVPSEYRTLLPFLLTPTCWQQKGSIPGLVKLLKAFLARDAAEMVKTGQITAVLAVVQQRLIPSKINDGWGFELLQGVVQHVPPAQLKQYFKAVVMTLLTRMQTSKTDKYVYLFSHFLLFTMAVNVDGLGPDYVISAVEEIQPQLWSQILANFIIPQVPKMPHKDRKIAAVGLIRMLTQSTFMLTPPSVQSWPPAFVSVIKLFSEPQYLSKSKDDEQSTGITEIDFEEQTAGYQAAYSRLAAAEGASIDPVAYVRDPRDFFGQALVKADPRVKGLLAAGDEKVVQPFVQALVASGYAIQ